MRKKKERTGKRNNPNRPFDKRFAREKKIVKTGGRKKKRGMDYRQQSTETKEGCQKTRAGKLGINRIKG